MFTGVFLHDHYYRRVCGKPLIGVERDGSRSHLSTKIASSTHLEVFRILADAGVYCVEMAAPLNRVEEMKDSLLNRGAMKMILHTEGDPAPSEIVSSNANIAAAAKYNILRNIDFAVELGVEKLVLHPPVFSDEALNVYESLVEYAEANKVVLAIENCPYGRDGIENLLKYKKILNSPFLKFTFDVGHCNIGWDVAEGVKAVIDDITHIHWHDNDGMADQHLGMGMGNVDFNQLSEFIMENGDPDITITLECDKPSVDYEKQLSMLQEMFL